MSLRLYKLVVPVEKIDPFVAFSKETVKPTMLRFSKPGGVRFFQSANSPLTFFLKVWWDSPISSIEYDNSVASKEVIDGVQPYLAERLKHWDLEVIEDDYSEEDPLFFDKDVSFRVAKLSISPASSKEMYEMYDRYTNDVTRKQPGCLSVKLLASTNVLDVFFIFSIWAKEQDSEAFMSTEAYTQLRQEALEVLENRVELWSLKVIGPGDTVYKILGGVIDPI